MKRSGSDAAHQGPPPVRPSRRVGRRPGDPAQTRREILAAAQRVFGANGYERATIRSIALEAHVDPALVIHHFHNKQQLFVAAHELPLDPERAVREIAAMPLPARGRALTTLYLTVVAAAGSPALSLLRAAATNDDAAHMLREFIEEALLPHGLALLEGPDAELRLALAFSHLIGVAIAREIVGIAPVAGRSLDDLIDAVAPTIQHYLDPP